MRLIPKCRAFARTSLAVIPLFGLIAAEGPVEETPDGPNDPAPKHSLPIRQMAQVGIDAALVRGLASLDFKQLQVDGSWAVIATHPSPGSGTARLVASADTLAAGGGDKPGSESLRKTIDGTYRIIARLAGEVPKTDELPYHWEVSAEPSDQPTTERDAIDNNFVFSHDGTALVHLDENAKGPLRFNALIRIPNEWASQVKPALVALAEPGINEHKKLQDHLRLATNPFLVLAGERALASLDPKAAADFALMPLAACDQAWVAATLVTIVAPAVAASKEDLQAHWNDLTKVIGKESIDRKAYEFAIGLYAARPLKRTSTPTTDWCNAQIKNFIERSKSIAPASSEFADKVLPALRYEWKLNGITNR